MCSLTTHKNKQTPGSNRNPGQKHKLTSGSQIEEGWKTVAETAGPQHQNVCNRGEPAAWECCKIPVHHSRGGSCEPSYSLPSEPQKPHFQLNPPACRWRLQPRVSIMLVAAPTVARMPFLSTKSGACVRLGHATKPSKHNSSLKPWPTEIVSNFNEEPPCMKGARRRFALTSYNKHECVFSVPRSRGNSDRDSTMHTNKQDTFVFEYARRRRYAQTQRRPPCIKHMQDNGVRAILRT